MNQAAPGRNNGAIIIGGDYRGLGVVRSLGRRGIPVCVLNDEHTLAGLSRFVSCRFKWPATEAEQLKFLLKLATHCGLAGWTLFPTGDEAAALIARNHACLEGRFALTTPSWNTLRWAYDKRLTYRLAAELGIAYPLTWYPRNREELSRLICAFPLVLKPAHKHKPSLFTRDKAWRASDHRELLTRYDEACSMIEPDAIMLQELIPGSGACQFSFAALCADGKPLASILAVRLRQHPIDFGHSSSYVESIEHPEVERLSRIILAAMRFTGLAEVEFKLDPCDGTLKLLDINPRVWGWHTLGARAGVDFPYLAWQLANGLKPEEARGRAGVHWMRVLTDLPAVLGQLRVGSLSLGSYLRSFRRPLEFAIWAIDDPIPSLFEIPTLLHANLTIRRTVARSGSCTGALPNRPHRLPSEL
jgi:D-aspartate ligase